ncbi:NUDIX hydrolase [Snodgrassella sp. CFCC 13594]|uniref:NUDIX hydrolase n=1 Tax=Snodgrassella sp. CFCC 13594 TaxID=1775559 RepID=UPI000831FF61|nr:NUDIX hydrolase [Snodgrassella sp. CFCC 13594]
MKLTETQLARKDIYQGQFLNVYEDEASLPNGNTASRVVVTHPGAASVLAITPEKKVVLVRQWRYPIGDALLEIPAGKLDIAGEKPDECAKRELAEETPYTATDVTLLATFYTSPGFCNEKMYVYLAENVVRNSQLNPEADEILEPELMDAAEVRQALADNRIHDAKTWVALQYWLLHG